MFPVRTPIQHSFYAIYFDDIDNQNIYLLSEELSEKIWKDYIDKKVFFYFQLPNDNWLIKSATQVIGQWVEDHNTTSGGRVAEALTEAVAWQDENAVCFCINSSHLIECPWREFKLFWINFLSCHDDAPIIINCNDRSAAFVFYRSDLVIIDGRPTKQTYYDNNHSNRNPCV